MAQSTETSPNLREIHDVLIDIAFEAGKVITSSLPTINSTDSKKNSPCTPAKVLYYVYTNQHTGSDLVTEYDKAVENMVSTRLKAKYPDYE
jgi:myo-inositol-1(or 4)-monophosphatase